MTQPKYGRDDIATIARRPGRRMNRVLRIAFLCLTVLVSALTPKAKARCNCDY